MEDNDELRDYYEITYLDDDNIIHFGRVENIAELNFMKERFEVTDYNFVSNY